ncbi:MAG: hypothetical protein ACK4ND_08030 [Cytophagaceae bacterium]
MQYIKSISFAWALLFCSFYIGAQDLSNIVEEEDPIKVSGGLGITNILYGATGIESRRDPWSYFVSGTVNIDIYGLSLPFSGTYSNQQGNFVQPFNQYGVSPKYKSLTGHIGYRSMTFSPYTLAGHIFLGAGVDYNPGIFRISAMYGRLNKATPEDTLMVGPSHPFYRRMGYGLKVGVGSDGNAIDLIIFRAKDDVLSLPFNPEGLSPEENLVIGLTARKVLYKKVSMGFDVGSSAYTRDVHTEKISDGGGGIFYGSGIMNRYASSTHQNALKGDITYNANRYDLQFAYERIDPGYRTLGAYFFNNDMENITVGASSRILKDKMNFSVNVGTQRNNLDQMQMNTMRRMIGSVNISYMPVDKVNMDLSYSNFTNNSRIEQRFDPLLEMDSLDYYQVTQSANGGISYNFGNKEKRQGVSVNGAYQIANDNLTREVSGDNKFYNASLAYRYSLTPISLTLSTGLNFNQTDMMETSNRMIGPMVSLSKALFNKQVKSILGGSWNNSYTGSELTGRIINVRWSNAYIYKKMHNLTMSFILVNRYNRKATVASFNEFTGTIGYAYNF